MNEEVGFELNTMVKLVKGMDMDHKLLISAAVLRTISKESEIVNTYTLLGAFVNYSISKRNLMEFCVEDCTAWLSEDFSFDIPNALVRSVVKNQIKVNAFNAVLSHGKYSLDEKIFYDKELDSSKEAETNNYSKVNLALIAYKSSDDKFSSITDENAKDALISFLSKDAILETHEVFISSFILSVERDDVISNILTSIEEGLILYSGIKYSSDANQIGSWPSDLIMFLDTEYLFNAGGMNGPVYQKIFDEFLELVRESNRGNKKGTITLHYFPEARDDLDRYFAAACAIASGESPMRERKPAMIRLVEKCNSRDDVLEEKARLFAKLESLYITEKNVSYNADNDKYNFERSGLAEIIKSDFERDYYRSVELDRVSNILQQATKINILRKGDNKRLTQVKSILLSGSAISSYVSRKYIELGDGTVPSISGMDFMTEKMWFQLGKGFGGDKAIPGSFDLVIRSKILLSGLVSNKAAKEYRGLLDKFSNGDLDEATTKHLVAGYMGGMSFNPENIDSDILPDVIGRLFEDDFIGVELEKQKNMIAAIENKDIRIRELEYANVAVIESKDIHIKALEEASRLKDEESSAAVIKEERLRLKASFIRIENNMKLRLSVHFKYERYAKYLGYASDSLVLLSIILLLILQFDAKLPVNYFISIVLALVSAASAVAYLVVFGKYIKSYMRDKLFRGLIVKDVRATEWAKKNSDLEG
jgi:hypothetical protein